jgi:Mn2+/Fe2+ NRAMP family transporter
LPHNKRINLKALGPGLLFAAMSVGISHLVQSTRAGAMYGLSLALVIILANVFKYPAFRFGSDYPAATGMSLLEGYRRQGKWALIFFGIASSAVAFFGISAISLVVAGLVKSTLGLSLDAALLGSFILIVTATILIIGHYRWLERITMVLIIFIAATTFFAAAMVLPDINWDLGSSESFGSIDFAGLLFIAALVGYMPSPLDASVWQSLWTRAKARHAGRSFTPRDVRNDFIIGYVGCVLLALCFLLLGAGLMHSRGIPVESGAGAFTGQLIGLYTEVLGGWTRPLIGLGALAIMYSTLLVAMDAVPRSLAALYERFSSPESADIVNTAEGRLSSYVTGMAVLVGGSLVVYHLFLESLTQLVDLGASIAFVSAPVIAWLNHRCMKGNEVPEHLRPSGRFNAFSAASILIMALFATTYLFLRFGPGTG